MELFTNSLSFLAKYLFFQSLGEMLSNKFVPSHCDSGTMAVKSFFQKIKQANYIIGQETEVHSRKL